MFTGIIETVGVVVKSEPSQAGARLVVEAGLGLPDVTLGESIAVGGTCLTVVAWDGDRALTFDVGPETLARTTLGGRTAGDRVNLERALRLGDRLGGHMVTGHVDGVGEVTRVTEAGEARFVRFGAPPEVRRYLVPKGSIAVDGTSLTVAGLDAGGFEVMLIPHTLAETTLGDLRPGTRVNLEADLVGKYVASLVEPYARAAEARSVST